MKLYIGAGDRRIPGWTGVDAVQRSGTDILADARSIPLEDGCASEVMAIHLVEHFYQWEVEAALAEWFRLLASEGTLILELPDIRKAARNLLAETRLPCKYEGQMDMWAMYGDPRHGDPYMTHRWGWTFNTLSPLVKKVGFRDITEHVTKFHLIGRELRDFRLEARKP